VELVGVAQPGRALPGALYEGSKSDADPGSSLCALDTLRWVFIAVALGGIAVTIYARLDDWKRGRR
jgi:hypothetical protein